MDDVLSDSRFASLIGMRLLDRSDGESRVELRVREDHANTRGIAHGGVVASLVDTAAGAAVAYQPSVGGAGVATVSLTTTYHAPARAGDVLCAHARLRGGGRRIVTCEVEVRGEDDAPVATALVTLTVVASS
jgi:uncharacterized protein (TIGR00369 family)